ncbi:hypothetical protein VNO77_19283 [Canavalia gladiata]|uniref:Uncharacterized protein n=1 Tax=Canavalia gladiata TaxID=3824 RepID=A0AAN9QKC6_CANGL
MNLGSGRHWNCISGPAIAITHVQSRKHMAVMGVFFLLKVFFFLDWVRHSLSDSRLFQASLRITVTGAVALGVGTTSGYISL